VNSTSRQQAQTPLEHTTNDWSGRIRHTH